jgi:hypothetical protein
VVAPLAVLGWRRSRRGRPGTGRSARQKVRSFLESRRGSWRDLNVPWQDGQLLHDLIVKHRYTRALEIGTSTGHSAIWIAWALSKTGGKLVTLEIDPDRHAAALKNFQEAGVAPFVDARLGDAHELVKTLPGSVRLRLLRRGQGLVHAVLQGRRAKLVPGAASTTPNNVSHARRRRGGVLEYVQRASRLRDHGRGQQRRRLDHMKAVVRERRSDAAGSWPRRRWVLSVRGRRSARTRRLSRRRSRS